MYLGCKKEGSWHGRKREVESQKKNIVIFVLPFTNEMSRTTLQFSISRHFFRNILVANYEILSKFYN